MEIIDDSLARSLRLSRRIFLTGVAAAALGLPGCSRHPVTSKADATRLVKTLGAMTLPDTDTPGAGTDEIANWVLLALDHGMKDGTTATITDLRLALDAAAHRAFLTAAPAAQLRALKSLDGALGNTGPQGRPQPWAIVKSLILRAYYNSEIGASRELRYEPVPGRYGPDVPVTPGERAFSTDALARNAG